MPQSTHGLWQEKDPFAAWLWQLSYTYTSELFWEGDLSTYDSIRWGERWGLSATSAYNRQQLKAPIFMYVKLNLDFWGAMVSYVWVIVTQELNKLSDNHNKTYLPGIISWTLIKLAYKVFKRKYGSQIFENIDCQTGVSPLLFLYLHVYYHNKGSRFQLDSISINPTGHEQQSKKTKNLPALKKGF